MLNEAEEAMADAEASQLDGRTVAKKIAESVKAENAPEGKPSPEALQNVLDLIARVDDDTRRATLFAAASLAVKGTALRKLVTDAQSVAKKKWNGKKGGAQKYEVAASAIDMPFWGKSYCKYHGRTYVLGFKDDAADFAIPLHSPLRLRSSVTYPDRKVQGRDAVRGVVVEFEDDKGAIRTLTFQRSDALSPTTNKDGMIQDLCNGGAVFTREGRDRFQNIVLSSGGLADGGSIFDYPGCRGPDFFISAGGEVIGETNLDAGLANPLSGIKTQGTLEKWCEATASAFCDEIVKKAPQIPAALIWGFVSPLVDRAREEMSFIMALSGRTTRLKTYSLRIMASIWGTTLPNGDGDAKEVGLLVTFNATPGKMMQYAIARSGCGLALDDSTLIAAEKLGPFLYQMATGSERGRMYEDGGMWRLGCIITSEVPIQQFLKAGNYDPPPGLMSRVVEIPILDDRVSDKPIDKLAGAFDNFGHAGPAFARAMQTGGWDKDKIKNGVKERLAKLLDGAGASEQARRAARGVAFIWLAGDIAKDAGLIPATFDVAAFAASLLSRVASGADTASDDIGRVKNRLAEELRNGGMAIHKFLNRDIALPTSEGSGAICVQRFGKNNDAVFVLTGATLAGMVGARVTVKDVAKALDDEGTILRQQDDRLTWKPGRAGVGNVPAYVLFAHEVLGDEAEEMIQEYWNARQRVEVTPRERLGVIEGGVG